MRLKPFLPFAAAALLLLTLDAVSGLFLVDRLDFGRSLNPPTPGFGRFLAFWLFFGSAAAGLVAWGLARLPGAGRFGARVAEAWTAAPDRKWIFYGTVFGLLVPAALRTFLLGGVPIADDESAYRLMAELVASGRVAGESPPLELFFDNRFLINDGQLYAHYFLGWPALLAPFVLLGVPGFANAVYSALTVPPLFRVLRRLAGSGWARVGVVLYLLSPVLMVAAATELSHTSCTAALAWFTWLCLRSRDADAPWWVHAGAAFAFSVAFFIRPSSALGVGLPLLLWWAVGALRAPGRGRWRAVVAFAVPAAVLAVLFLGVNKLQTGSFFEVAYQRAYSYAQENDFRFSLWPEAVEGGAFTELRFGDLRRSLAVAGSGLFRLGVGFLGWPCSFLFAFFAGRGRLRATLWLSVVGYFALHFFTDNVGFDTFAPMHYFEVAWPLLLLNVAGLERLTTAGAELDGAVAAQSSAPPAKPPRPGRWARLPATLAVALVAVTAVGYLPLRFEAIRKVADNVAMPWRALEEAGIERAVIFAPEPFVVYCRHPPTRGWVFVRPNNDPELENDVLWVNHLSLEKNRLLMRRFPDREGYVMIWDRRCEVVYLPLDQLPPGSIPDAAVSGIDEVGVD